MTIGGRELGYEGTAIPAGLAMAMVIVKQSDKIGCLRNRECLLDLDLNPWVEDQVAGKARQCRVTAAVLFEGSSHVDH